MRYIALLVILLFSVKGNAQVTLECFDCTNMLTDGCSVCDNKLHFELFKGLKVTKAGKVTWISSPYKVYYEGERVHLNDWEGNYVTFLIRETSKEKQELDELIRNCKCPVRGFTINAGNTDSLSDEAFGSDEFMPGDTLHFFSPDTTVQIDVTPNTRVAVRLSDKFLDRIDEIDSLLRDHILNDRDTSPTNELDTFFVETQGQIINGDTIFLQWIYDSLLAHRIDIDDNRLMIEMIKDTLVVHRQILNLHDKLIGDIFDTLVVHRQQIDINTSMIEMIKDTLVVHRREINNLKDSIWEHRRELEIIKDTLRSHRVDLDRLFYLDSIDFDKDSTNELDSFYFREWLYRGDTIKASNGYKLSREACILDSIENPIVSFSATNVAGGAQKNYFIGFSYDGQYYEYMPYFGISSDVEQEPGVIMSSILGVIDIDQVASDLKQYFETSTGLTFPPLSDWSTNGNFITIDFSGNTHTADGNLMDFVTFGRQSICGGQFPICGGGFNNNPVLIDQNTTFAYTRGHVEFIHNYLGQVIDTLVINESGDTLENDFVLGTCNFDSLDLDMDPTNELDSFFDGTKWVSNGDTLTRIDRISEILCANFYIDEEIDLFEYTFRLPRLVQQPSTVSISGFTYDGVRYEIYNVPVSNFSVDPSTYNNLYLYSQGVQNENFIDTLIKHLTDSIGIDIPPAENWEVLDLLSFKVDANGYDFDPSLLSFDGHYHEPRLSGGIQSYVIDYLGFVRSRTTTQERINDTLFTEVNRVVTIVDDVPFDTTYFDLDGNQVQPDNIAYLGQCLDSLYGLYEDLEKRFNEDYKYTRQSICITNLTAAVCNTYSIKIEDGLNYVLGFTYDGNYYELTPYVALQDPSALNPIYTHTDFRSELKDTIEALIGEALPDTSLWEIQNDMLKIYFAGMYTADPMLFESISIGWYENGLSSRRESSSSTETTFIDGFNSQGFIDIYWNRDSLPIDTVFWDRDGNRIEDPVWQYGTCLDEVYAEIDTLHQRIDSLYEKTRQTICVAEYPRHLSSAFSAVINSGINYILGFTYDGTYYEISPYAEIPNPIPTDALYVTNDTFNPNLLSELKAEMESLTGLTFPDLQYWSVIDDMFVNIEYMGSYTADPMALESVSIGNRTNNTSSQRTSNAQTETVREEPVYSAGFIDIYWDIDSNAIDTFFYNENNEEIYPEFWAYGQCLDDIQDQIDSLHKRIDSIYEKTRQTICYETYEEAISVSFAYRAGFGDNYIVGFEYGGQYYEITPYTALGSPFPINPIFTIRADGSVDFDDWIVEFKDTFETLTGLVLPSLENWYEPTSGVFTIDFVGNYTAVPTDFMMFHTGRWNNGFGASQRESFAITETIDGDPIYNQGFVDIYWNWDSVAIDTIFYDSTGVREIDVTQWEYGVCLDDIYDRLDSIEKDIDSLFKLDSLDTDCKMETVCIDTGGQRFNGVVYYTIWKDGRVDTLLLSGTDTISDFISYEYGQCLDGINDRIDSLGREIDTIKRDIDSLFYLDSIDTDIVEETVCALFIDSVTVPENGVIFDVHYEFISGPHSSAIDIITYDGQSIDYYDQDALGVNSDPANSPLWIRSQTGGHNPDFLQNLISILENDFGVSCPPINLWDLDTSNPTPVLRIQGYQGYDFDPTLLDIGVYYYLLFPPPTPLRVGAAISPEDEYMANDRVLDTLKREVVKRITYLKGEVLDTVFLDGLDTIEVDAVEWYGSCLDTIFDLINQNNANDRDKDPTNELDTFYQNGRILVNGDTIENYVQHFERVCMFDPRYDTLVLDGFRVNEFDVLNNVGFEVYEVPLFIGGVSYAGQNVEAGSPLILIDSDTMPNDNFKWQLDSFLFDAFGILIDNPEYIVINEEPLRGFTFPEQSDVDASDFVFGIRSQNFGAQYTPTPETLRFPMFIRENEIKANRVITIIDNVVIDTVYLDDEGNEVSRQIVDDLCFDNSALEDDLELIRRKDKDKDPTNELDSFYFDGWLYNGDTIKASNEYKLAREACILDSIENPIISFSATNSAGTAQKNYFIGFSYDGDYYEYMPYFGTSTDIEEEPTAILTARFGVIDIESVAPQIKAFFEASTGLTFPSLSDWSIDGAAITIDFSGNTHTADGNLMDFVTIGRQSFCGALGLCGGGSANNPVTVNQNLTVDYSPGHVEFIHNYLGQIIDTLIISQTGDTLNSAFLLGTCNFDSLDRDMDPTNELDSFFVNGEYIKGGDTIYFNDHVDKFECIELASGFKTLETRYLLDEAQNVLDSFILTDTTGFGPFTKVPCEDVIFTQPFVCEDCDSTNEIDSIFFTGDGWIFNGDTIGCMTEVLDSFGLVNTNQNIGLPNSLTTTARDIDNDGDIDLIFGFNDGEPTQILKNNGFGDFTVWQELDFNGNRVSSHAVADLDNDGDLDIVESVEHARNNIFLNDGFGTFTRSPQLVDSIPPFGIAIPADYPVSRCVTTADYNGDGFQDIYIGNDRDLNYLFISDGSGGYEPGVEYGTNNWTAEVLSVDIDNDGDIDIIEANRCTSGTCSGPLPEQENKIRLNNGSGVFTESPSSLGFGNTHGIVAIDVDGDNDIDIVTANGETDGAGATDYSPLESSVWLNDGFGGFTKGQDLQPANNNTRGVNAVDFDRDGDLDLYFGNADAPNEVWQNDGTGNFTLFQQINSSERTFAVNFADVNGDGWSDLITANYDGFNNVFEFVPFFIMIEEEFACASDLRDLEREFRFLERRLNDITTGAGSDRDKSPTNEIDSFYVEVSDNAMREGWKYNEDTIRIPNRGQAVLSQRIATSPGPVGTNELTVGVFRFRFIVENGEFYWELLSETTPQDIIAKRGTAIEEITVPNASMIRLPVAFSRVRTMDQVIFTTFNDSDQDYTYKITGMVAEGTGANKGVIFIEYAKDQIFLGNF